MPDTVLDLIQDSLEEIGVYAPSEVPTAADANKALRVLNRMMDQWGARKLFAYNVNFSDFTLTPGRQPHTIGPSAGSDLTTTFRPARIENAALILNNVTPAVDVPLRIRDDDWWANQRVKDLATNVPTDLYYSPDIPDGSLYLWPVPSFAYGLRLETWVSVGQFTALPDTLSLPPGYHEAIMLSLAERLARPFGKTVPPDLANDANRARVTIQKNNDKSPRISAVPYSSKPKGSFNYYSGQ
jgi:hypothetical protein